MIINLPCRPPGLRYGYVYVRVAMLHAVSGRLCRSFSGARHNESNSIDDDGYGVTTTSANFPTAMESGRNESNKRQAGNWYRVCRV